MTAIDVPHREDVVGQEAAPPASPSERSRPPVIALLAVATLGFWIGWLLRGRRVRH